MCVDRRRALFVEPRLVSRISGQILRTFGDGEFAILAMTFMPDHAHLLVEGLSESSDFRTTLRLVRRRSAAACPPELRPLWQDGYHERVLRGDGAAGVIDYILNNPVKAGLVERAPDYPFSWSVRSR